MQHRHLTHSEWTLAAVDDTIARGRLDDSKELRDAAGDHVRVRERIVRVCAAHLADPTEQRYYFCESDITDGNAADGICTGPLWPNRAASGASSPSTARLSCAHTRPRP